MVSYALTDRRKTPQNKAIPGKEKQMIQAACGGYLFKEDDIQTVRRMLVLGTTDNSFYVGKEELTEVFMGKLLSVAKTHPSLLAEEIVKASDGNTMCRPAPILALILLGMAETKEASEKFHEIFPKVIRTWSHFCEWLSYTRKLRGFGHSIRKAGTDWINGRSADNLTYQMLKYGNRNGYAVRDILRLFHVKPKTTDHDELFHYMVKGPKPEFKYEGNLSMIGAYEALKNKQVSGVGAIQNGGLTHEMVTGVTKMDAETWRALAVQMPIGALMRNLGSLSANIPDHNDSVFALIAEKITSPEILLKGRISPADVAKALYTYRQGCGIRGSLAWNVHPKILNALQTALNITMNKAEINFNQDLKYAIWMDTSGSMNVNAQNHPMSCKQIEFLMAKVVSNRVSNCTLNTFTDNAMKVEDANIIKNIESFDDVLRATVRFSSGGTDCSVPFLHMTKNKTHADVVIMFTDSESWAGAKGHTSQLLAQYRKEVNPDVKVVYVTLAPNTGYTLMEPEDRNSLNIAGFNSDVIKAIADFSNNVL